MKNNKQSILFAPWSVVSNLLGVRFQTVPNDDWPRATVLHAAAQAVERGQMDRAGFDWPAGALLPISAGLETAWLFAVESSAAKLTVSPVAWVVGTVPLHVLTDVLAAVALALDNRLAWETLKVPVKLDALELIWASVKRGSGDELVVEYEQPDNVHISVVAIRMGSDGETTWVVTKAVRR
jgi:hypothetical protein